MKNSLDELYDEVTAELENANSKVIELEEEVDKLREVINELEDKVEEEHYCDKCKALVNLKT